MKTNRAFFLVLIISFISLHNVFAQDFHKKGDFQLGLRMPFSIPLLTSDIGKKPVSTVYFWDTGYKNIIVGIEADIGIFTSSKISIGGLLGYNFAYDRGENLFSRVPLLFRANYFPISTRKHEVLFSLGAGITYSKYRFMEHVVPQISLETGFNVYWSDMWSASFRTGANIYTELYADSKKNNISVTIPLIFGVTYRK